MTTTTIGGFGNGIALRHNSSNVVNLVMFDGHTASWNTATAKANNLVGPQNNSYSNTLPWQDQN